MFAEPTAFASPKQRKHLFYMLSKWQRSAVITAALVLALRPNFRPRINLRLQPLPHGPRTWSGIMRTVLVNTQLVNDVAVMRGIDGALPSPAHLHPPLARIQHTLTTPHAHAHAHTHSLYAPAPDGSLPCDCR